MSYSRSYRPRFTHCARTMGDELSPLKNPISMEAIRCAFPDLFDALVVAMFMSSKGYVGQTDNEYEPSSGCLYGLNYGVIHRDMLPVWRVYSRWIRGIFWKGCWKIITSFGRESFLQRKHIPTIIVAFFNPLPIELFDRALDRLVRSGMLTKTDEMILGVSEEEHMYYPTEALLRTLEENRQLTTS